jgi:hypothetical protein
MAIHQQFGDWYRPAAVTPAEGVLDKRWKGVEEIAKQPDPNQLLDLARLFVMPNAPESSVPVGFRESLHAHDDFFPLKGGLQELRVLAGIVIRLVIEGAHPLAPLAALALVCGSFGAREALLPDREHLDFAQRFLVKYSRRTRESTSPVPIAIPALTSETFSQMFNATWFQTNQTTNLRDPLLNALNEIVSTFSSSLGQAQKAIDQLTQAAKVREEEVGILWWLETQFSRDLKKSFSDLGYASGALVLPKELADLTISVPGSDVAIAVLAHALALSGAPAISEEISIANTTNETPRDWREALCVDKVGSLGILSPVLLAIHKSLETDGRDEWLPVYRKACDIPVDRPFPIIQISLQLYHERMLLRAFREASS